jgi:hypothetical protein
MGGGDIKIDGDGRRSDGMEIRAFNHFFSAVHRRRLRITS